MRKVSALCGLLCALCVSAQGAASFGPYTNFTQNGYIAAGGDPVVSDSSPNPSGLDSTIYSYTLTLTFSDYNHLTGMLGTLGLYLVSTNYESFSPSDFATSDNQTWYKTFDEGSSLFDLNPNTTWTLELYQPNSPGDENQITSWNLEITALPEPSAMALVVFGLCVAGFGAWRRALRRARI